MNARIRTLALVMVLAFACQGAARAQYSVVAPATSDVSAFSPSRGAVVNAMSLDLSAMDERAWRQLARDTRRGLWAHDRQARVQSLQNLLHVSRMYPGRVDFSGSTERLCRLAMFDRKEGLRVMAVAALRAVDTPEAMGCLVEIAQALPTDRVRKVTNFALADYVASGMRAVR